MADKNTDKEARMLTMMKRVLTEIAKETYTTPGFKHPLSDNTITGIRECLALITAREAEIKAANGETSTARPKLPGDKPDKVVVQLKPHKKDKE
jgi:hypothetical protein